MFRKKLRKLIYKDELYYFRYKESYSGFGVPVYDLYVYVENTEWWSKIKKYRLITHDHITTLFVDNTKEFTKEFLSKEHLVNKVKSYLEEQRLLDNRRVKINNKKTIVADCSPEIMDLYS